MRAVPRIHGSTSHGERESAQIALVTQRIMTTDTASLEKEKKGS